MTRSDVCSDAGVLALQGVCRKWVCQFAVEMESELVVRRWMLLLLNQPAAAYCVKSPGQPLAEKEIGHAAVVEAEEPAWAPWRGPYLPYLASQDGYCPHANLALAVEIVRQCGSADWG